MFDNSRENNVEVMLGNPKKALLRMSIPLIISSAVLFRENNSIDFFGSLS